MEVQSSAVAPEAQNATPTEEAPSVEASSPKVEDKSKEQAEFEMEMARRFTSLTKREKQTLERERKLKEQWGEVENYQKAKELAKKDIDSFLRAHGLDYSKVTDFYLNNSKPTPEMQIEALREQIEQDKRDREARALRDEEEQVNRVVEGHKVQIRDYIDSKPDDFELIRTHDAYDTVFETIEEVWKKTGQILPMDKAAAQIEEELENETKRLLGLKKVQKLYKPSESVSEEEPSKETVSPEKSPTVPKMVVSGQSTSPKTLTNTMVSQATPAGKEPYLSDDESKKRMAEFIKAEMAKRAKVS